MKINRFENSHHPWSQQPIYNSQQPHHSGFIGLIPKSIVINGVTLDKQNHIILNASS
jgi:hypothetical protein